MTSLPLLPAADSGTVQAYRNGQPVTRAEFARDVLALAPRLPNIGHALNMCADRYWFAVALFAAISRGVVSLLPNSPAAEAIASLCAGLPQVFCLGDQDCPAIERIPYLSVSEASADVPPSRPNLPLIAFDQRVASVFTSGSTGQPVPHDKTFGRLNLDIRVSSERIWAAAGAPCAVLGTVPLRHMYGLEATVLLPVLGGGILSSRTPFYPADIAAALAELPAPRLLVSTPFHLHKLLEADIDIPPVAAVLSATAPLSGELARRVEERLGAPLMEIYGSTETGQLALRRPVVQTEWQTLGAIALRQEGDETIAEGGHLESRQVLNDAVELLSPTVFRLIDRHANMVNIAGKRSSLGFLNHVISSIPGVRDGVFCLRSGAAAADVDRLVAFVVAPGLDAAAVLGALRPHLDPVFLPRPIVFVDALPRDGNGKISAAAMQALMDRHIGRKA